MAGTPKRVLLEVRVPVAGKSSSPKTTRDVKWIFPGETLTVGRSTEHVELAFETDAGMSKRHFEISFDGETCRLTDLRSTNGTRVNGKPVKRVAVLADGDEICAGKTIFGVGILDEFDQPEPRLADTQPMSPDVLNELAPDEIQASLPADPADKLPKVASLRLITHSAPFGFTGRQMAWIRPGQTLVVGSSEDEADWQVPEEWGISPAHFKVSFDGKICSLRSCGDQHGTFVNGHAVVEVQLCDGDTIEAGAISFFVQLA